MEVDHGRNSMNNENSAFQKIMDFHPDNIYVYEEIKRNLCVLVPFIGAGFSAFCYGTWKQTIEKLICKLTDEKSIAEINRLLNAEENYAKIAQILAEKRTLFNLKKDIALLFSEEKMTVEKMRQVQKEPVYLLPKLFQGLMLTTNFDCMLEKVYDLHGKKLSVFHPGHTEMLNYYSRENLEYGLFKLHGSVVRGELEGSTLVFTEDQYKKHYKKGMLLYETLKACLAQKTILFLGCSLSQDKTLEVLKTVMQPGMSYYTIMECEQEKRDEKIRELGEKQIRAILYKNGQHESVRVILEHLLEETDPEAYHKLCRHIGAQDQNVFANRFTYKSRFVPMVGRKSELDQLLHFFEDERMFLWWAVIGPGGSGKSRLVYDFICEYLPTGYSVKYIQLEEYTNLSKLNSGLTDKCFLIADYVQAYTKQFGDWIEYLAESKRSLPLRLLLIERANESSEHEDNFWGKDLFRKDLVCRSCYCIEQNTLSYSYHRNQPKFLFLKALSDKELMTIMERYFQSMKNICGFVPEEMRMKRSELSAKTKEMLLEKLKIIDPHLHRPLYILLLTDAYLYMGNPEKWSRNEILQYVVEHEREQLRKALLLMKNDAREDEKLLELCIKIKCIATILQDVTLQQLQDEICSNDWGIIEKKADSFPSVKKFFQRIGLAEGNFIFAVKPDLIGEYAVCRWLLEQEEKMVYDLLMILWRFPKRTAMFFEKLFSDYEDLLNRKPAYWNLFFPDEVTLEDYAVHAYTRLLSIAVRKCRNYKKSFRMLNLLIAIYEQWKANTDIQVLMAKGLVNFSDNHYHEPGSYIIQVMDLERKPPIAKYVMEDLERIYKENPNNKELARIIAYRLVARYTVNGEEINLSFKQDRSILSNLKKIMEDFPDDKEIVTLFAFELIRFSAKKISASEAVDIMDDLKMLYERYNGNVDTALYLAMGLHNLIAVYADNTYIAYCITYQQLFYQKYGSYENFAVELSRGIVNLCARQDAAQALESVTFLKEICKQFDNNLKLEENLARSLVNLSAKQDDLQNEENIECLFRLYRKHTDKKVFLEELTYGLVNTAASKKLSLTETAIKNLMDLYVQYKDHKDDAYIVKSLADGLINLSGRHNVSEAAKSLEIMQDIVKESADSVDLTEEFACVLVNLSAKQDALKAKECIQRLKEFCKDTENKTLNALLEKAKMNLKLKQTVSCSEMQTLQVIEKRYCTLMTGYVMYAPNYNSNRDMTIVTVSEIEHVEKEEM